MDGLRNTVLIDGKPRITKRIWRRKTGSMQAVCCHLWLTSHPRRIVTKFQWLYPCFRGRAVQQYEFWYCKMLSYTRNSCQKIQTGSNYICRRCRRIIPTNVSKFSWTLNVHFQESSRWRFVYSCHANWDSVASGLVWYRRQHHRTARWTSNTWV